MTTTRETADHAELAACPFCGGPHLKHIAVSSEDEPTWQIAWQVFCETCHARGPASIRIGWCETESEASFAWNRRPREAALLSEIAALRGELAQSKREYRDDVGKHIARAAQAKRQRDKLRKALERAADDLRDIGGQSPRPSNSPDPEHENYLRRVLISLAQVGNTRARQALANHGADQ